MRTSRTRGLRQQHQSEGKLFLNNYFNFFLLFYFFWGVGNPYSHRKSPQDSPVAHWSQSEILNIESFALGHGEIPSMLSLPLPGLEFWYFLDSSWFPVLLQIREILLDMPRNSPALISLHWWSPSFAVTSVTIPGSAQGWTRLEGVPAHNRREWDDPQGLSHPKPFHDSMIYSFSPKQSHFTPNI